METKEDPAERHGKLYIDVTVIQIDKTIFKIPFRYFKENSEVFRAASEVSAGSQTGEGLSDENPIKLSPLPHDAKAEDFELLVNVVMAFTFNLPPPTGYTLLQWLAVLKLATAWEFSDIRALAMKSITADQTRNYDQWFEIFEFCWNLVGFSELRELAISRVFGLQNWSPMQKFENGRGYRVRGWAFDGLKELAEAPNLPSPKDLENLGFRMVLNFLFLREEVRNRCSYCAQQVDAMLCYNCRNGWGSSKRERCDHAVIEKYFAQELSQIE
ncbi:hypothetical protein L218DRAFT_983913 [Marasmius fiardii PR-910]|nr:hypothetical protein L218DRAFT_983913 [Marasmius fiardii PR-910]